MADEVDNIPYGNQPLDATGTGQARALSADARRGEGNVLAYLDPSGNRLAWTGDESAPFVRVLKSVPGLVAVTDVANGVGVLIAAVVAASLHEAWVTDFRSTSGSPSPRWVQLFDGQAIPSTGAVPSYAPIPLPAGDIAYLGFLDAPLGFNSGIVIAISSSAGTYTPLGKVTDYAITARVLGE